MAQCELIPSFPHTSRVGVVFVRYSPRAPPPQASYGPPCRSCTWKTLWRVSVGGRDGARCVVCQAAPTPLARPTLPSPLSPQASVTCPPS